jgi:branched-chain amino acid transport system permease protein
LAHAAWRYQFLSWTGARYRAGGRIAFALAASIGAVSGALIVAVTTIDDDTGFIVGLKGFVAAIVGGLVSWPSMRKN